MKRAAMFLRNSRTTDSLRHGQLASSSPVWGRAFAACAVFWNSRITDSLRHRQMASSSPVWGRTFAACALFWASRTTDSFRHGQLASSSLVWGRAFAACAVFWASRATDSLRHGQLASSSPVWGRALGACGLVGLSLFAAEPPAEVRQALAKHNRAVWAKDGWVRDPFIALAPDGYYYYTGTTQPPGKPEEIYNTGLGPKSLVGWQVQAWRSRDLVEWESLGTPFSLEDGIWHQTERRRFDETPRAEWRLWAPELHWLGDRWALVHTSPAPVRGANLSLTNGPDLRGPWTNPAGAGIGIRHDPSLFKDDDGTWWLVWGATEIAPLSKDFTKLTGDPVKIGPSGAFAKMGHEGCLIKKIAGKYVLFGTGWSTGQMRKGSYNLYYAVADKITGPYGERKFVGRFLGHGTPFQDKRGRWWSTAFYNANVPPIGAEGIQQRDLSADAQTINRQGLTLVPLDVRTIRGELVIRAKDPRYAIPGPDEVQKFGTRSR